MKCKICKKNFDSTSKIHPIYEKQDSDDYLVHIECFKCELCKTVLHELDQYYFDLNEILLCKACTIDSYFNQKCKRKISNRTERLSSKQKEMIKKKMLLVENFDDLNFDLDDFAKHIDCTLKSLLKYVDKQFNKKLKLPNCGTNSDILFLLDNNSSNCDNMMDQLKKLDKTIAPNKNPFCLLN